MNKILCVLLLVLVVVAVGCTDDKKATKLLESQNYTKVEITGYAYTGCGKHDYWRTGFTAVSPNGNLVSGVVCEGVLKGQTIRFD